MFLPTFKSVVVCIYHCFYNIPLNWIISIQLNIKEVKINTEKKMTNPLDKCKLEEICAISATRWAWALSRSGRSVGAIGSGDLCVKNLRELIM
jgi:hypothetical protein